MTSTGNTLAYRRLRAPHEHGQTLIDPPLSQANSLLQQNIKLMNQHDYDCQGSSLRELALAGRQDLIEQAHRYASAYRDAGDLPKQDDQSPILLSGHQPWLFHPGVWFKNFALSDLGKKLSARAINLIIDNDTLHSTSLRVPCGTIDEPRVETVQLDRTTDEMPYEERSLLDRSLFSSFGRRVTETIAPLVENPVINQLWPQAVEAIKQTENLGRALAQARHRLEGDWGLKTWELPLSKICSSESFLWFSVHLLANLPKLQTIYNAALAQYRHLNRVRNQAHPVPNLVTNDDWLEAPFWLWHRDDPTRRKLFVRLTKNEIVLSDRNQIYETLSISQNRTAGDGVQQLKQLESLGLKLRPRALITTMYARLILSDLFLHGIGGAKYDQLTDAIVNQFFGFRPPKFLTLTATVHLPIEQERFDIEELRQVNRSLRELDYNPQRHVDSDHPQAVELVEEKKRWLETTQPRKERHQQITRLNIALQKFVEKKRELFLRQRDKITAGLRKEAILTSREYSYCLFPEKEIRPLLLEISSREA